ncbi:MAG: serine protease [Planctomycetes bacterium]|nr:serine protease [Planctomycetota bacterium]
MLFARIALFASFVLLAGCKTYQEHPGPIEYPGGRDPSGTITEATPVPTDGGPVYAEISAWTSSLGASLAPTASIGCLPLTSYDIRNESPRVTLLGEQIADEVANALRAGGGQVVLGLNDMEIRAMQGNLAKITLSTLPLVARYGSRLGCDVICFGTLRHERNVNDTWGQARITVDLSAWDGTANRIIGSRKFAISSQDPGSRRWFEAAKSDSPWDEESKWNVPQPARSFQAEMEVVAGLLCDRLLGAIDPSQVEGNVYLPPADTSRFVRSVARLRAAQVAFASELGRRAQAAEKSGGAIDGNAPLSLVGIEFKNMQAAEDYLSVLTEGLGASHAAQFGLSVSNMLAERLQPKFAQSKFSVKDLGATKWSDTQLIEGELAQGGLINSQLARKALQDAGYQIVIAQRLEKFGDAHVLRAVVHDVKADRVLTTAHVAIAPEFQQDLKKELEVEEYGIDFVPIREVAADARASWDDTYKKVVTGVVLLSGQEGDQKGVGTGFVVSADGLIMTNSHVAKGIGAAPSASFADGSRVPVRLVLDNPYWDVAVLRAERLPAGTHEFAFAQEDQSRVGAEVAVLGHPKSTGGWVLSPGHLSSLREMVQTTSDKEPRPSYLYTCATREGTSGSPVMLLGGKVVAVNSHGLLGQVMNSATRTELTGFAIGCPGVEAQKVLETARNLQ